LRSTDPLYIRTFSLGYEANWRGVHDPTRSIRQLHNRKYRL
jgi:hypothetical protein